MYVLYDIREGDGGENTSAVSAAELSSHHIKHNSNPFPAASMSSSSVFDEFLYKDGLHDALIFDSSYHPRFTQQRDFEHRISDALPYLGIQSNLDPSTAVFVASVKLPPEFKSLKKYVNRLNGEFKRAALQDNTLSGASRGNTVADGQLRSVLQLDSQASKMAAGIYAVLPKLREVLQTAAIEKEANDDDENRTRLVKSYLAWSNTSIKSEFISKLKGCMALYANKEIYSPRFGTYQRTMYQWQIPVGNVTKFGRSYLSNLELEERNKVIETYADTLQLNGSLGAKWPDGYRLTDSMSEYGRKTLNAMRAAAKSDKQAIMTVTKSSKLFDDIKYPETAEKFGSFGSPGIKGGKGIDSVPGVQVDALAALRQCYTFGPSSYVRDDHTGEILEQFCTYLHKAPGLVGSTYNNPADGSWSSAVQERETHRVQFNKLRLEDFGANNTKPAIQEEYEAKRTSLFRIENCYAELTAKALEREELRGTEVRVCTRQYAHVKKGLLATAVGNIGATVRRAKISEISDYLATAMDEVSRIERETWARYGSVCTDADRELISRALAQQKILLLGVMKDRSEYQIDGDIKVQSCNTTAYIPGETVPKDIARAYDTAKKNFPKQIHSKGIQETRDTMRTLVETLEDRLTAMPIGSLSSK